MDIVISSAHGARIRGAAGYLDEVNESRKVVTRVAQFLGGAGVGVKTFNDDTSTTQSQNLKTIVDYHNKQKRDLDVSIHFNAYQTTSKPMGTECLYVTQARLATDTAAAMSRSGGFINRGPKKRTNLYFLNNTAKHAVLLEICFVDSSADAELYKKNYEGICKAIAEVIGQVKIGEPEPPPEIAPPPEQPFDQFEIKCSVFGGAKDPNDSAYPPFDKITDKEISVALPFRFVGLRPKVLIRNNATGNEAICEIRDIGPWLIDDPYWELGERPLAETCFNNKTPLPRGPHKGKIPNGAGVDITPAAAKAIGLSGMGFVDWRFIDPDEEIA